MANHSGISDSGAFFQIVPTTKKIIVPAGHKIIGAVNDHNSEQITFKCPKLIDGHNIAECTRKFVVWENARGDSDRDLLGDISIDGEYAYLKWTISDLITVAAGYIKFAVSFEDIENGKTVYSWSTGNCEECYVIETLATKSPSRVEGSIPDGYVKIAENGMSVTENGSYPTVYEFSDGTKYAYPKVNVNVPDGTPTLKTLTVTENKTYNAAEDDCDGYSKVTANVIPELEKCEIELKENKTYEKTPTKGKYFSEVKAIPKLQAKTAYVTGDGEKITPDKGEDGEPLYCGLSEVTVYLATAGPKYQEKTAYANNDIVRPDLGYDAFTAVEIKIPEEDGEATPSKEEQTIEPKGENALLRKVTVKPIPDNYVIPTGTLPITSNGNGQKVSGYAYIDVNVPSEATPLIPLMVEKVNFAAGDMVLTTTGNQGWNQVTIFKPENLKPEYIKAGITIAGITGTYEGATDGESGGGEAEITGERMYVGRTTAMSISSLANLKDQGNTKLESTTWSFTTKGAGYLYLCIPYGRAVTVRQSGFDVPLTNGGEFTQNGVKYLAYRTGAPQVGDTYIWSITIY